MILLIRTHAWAMFDVDPDTLGAPTFPFTRAEIPPDAQPPPAERALCDTALTVGREANPLPLTFI